MTRPTQEQIDAVEAKAAVDPDIVRAAMSRVPPSWTLVQPRINGGVFVRGVVNVIFTVQRYEDPRTGAWDVWLHVSASGRRGTYSVLPEWENLKRVKNDFIGKDRWAYQVFPDEQHYINQNPAMLHLFALFEDQRNALPDFTYGLGAL